MSNTPLFVHSSIDDAGLSPGAFRVLCHLQRRAQNKPAAFPGIRSIARICRMNWHTVIDAIRELEQSGQIVAQRKPGRHTVYRLFPKPKLGSEIGSKTTQVDAASVAYLGNTVVAKGVAHLDNGVLPTQATECCLTKSAKVVPQPLELPEGTPIRYPNKVLHRSADALTHSLSYGKEEEVTEKEVDRSLLSRRNAEPEENASSSVTKSETKNEPRQRHTALRDRPRISGERPESEADVVAYVLSRGYREEDGKYMWANWKSNGFTNAGRPIRDWKAVIDSRACQGFLPSQKKLAERAADKRRVRNLI
jgi:Helix-turn-helix domain